MKVPNKLTKFEEAYEAYLVLNPGRPYDPLQMEVHMLDALKRTLDASLDLRFSRRCPYRRVVHLKIGMTTSPRWVVTFRGREIYNKSMSGDRGCLRDLARSAPVQVLYGLAKRAQIELLKDQLSATKEDWAIDRVLERLGRAS